eukprot:10703375-Prorocentrum_lima.AAC.1
MRTTYVEPTNTNKKVYQKAEEAINERVKGTRRRVVPLGYDYDIRKEKWMAKVVQAAVGDPVRTGVFDGPQE